ncbi:MAG TPA: VOC family protein [Chthoniobacteraceae bacterium]
MIPKITIITLGASDYEKSVAFYRDGLKFPLENDGKDIAFFKLGDLRLAIYPREKLAEDAEVSAEGSGFRAFTLAHNVGSKEEVRETLAFAEKAGAKIIKPAQDVFWGGYSGYFADPDNFLWEVAWSPF